MKNRVLSHIVLTFYTVLITTGLLLYYVSSAPAPDGLIPTFYLWSSFSYYAFGLMLVGLLLAPLVLSRWTRWIVPIFVWLWVVYLLVDAATFNLYRFHVDRLLLEIFIFDFQGMGLPVFLLVLGGLVAAFLLALAFLLQWWSQKASARRGYAFSMILLMVIPVFALNSVISIWAYQYDREEVTQYAAYLPIFYPMTSRYDAKPLTELLPSLFPALAGNAVAATNAHEGIVRYPTETMSCSAKEPQSILIIALESWQADALDADVMPNLWTFAQSAVRFDHHVASGSATVPGLFGLLYGLHATYYETFKSAPLSHPSLFTETLRTQGYRTRVFTSDNLERFALKTLFFSKLAEGDYHHDRADAAILDAYLKSLDDPARRNRPNFDFMFLTSSHSPYRYPAEYARFEPLPAVEGGYVLDKMADAAPYKNDYHNSLFYIDSLLGKIFARLQADGTLEKTWVVITGDHAEEFNENGSGYWGHGSNFTRWQTQTPLIVRPPGMTSGRVETRTSLHQDIVPTLMQDVLKCRNARETYSNGANLFDLPPTRATILSSYFVNAYWVNGVVYEKMSGNKYSWDDIRQSKSSPDAAAIKALLKEETRFISPLDNTGQQLAAKPGAD